MSTRGLYALALVCAVITMPAIVSAQAPVANFSASKTSGCSPVVVQFTDQSTGSPTSWSWDLGNGGSSSIQNPAAAYITPGTYTVILTATNANGSTKDTNIITVFTSPSVAFTADTTITCGTKTVSYTNQTVAGAPGTISYLWDFGDGDSSTSVNPTHTYAQSGNYTVSLIAVNGSGCTSTLTKNNYIQILPKPATNFTASSTSSCTSPFQVTFTNNTTNGVSYEWNFGDGNTSIASNPTHTYNSSGSYTVRLISTGTNGCKDTLTKSSYIVIGQVVANFTTGPACQGKSVSFTNTTTPGLGVSRLWSFGTGATDTASNPTYTYTSTGTYTVTLIEQYANSCSDTVTKSVTVSSSPTAQFASSDTVGCTTPFNASFSNSSTGATSYYWSSGSNTSTSSTPTFSYGSLGLYNVTLTAINSAGCTDTLKKTNYIKLQVPDAILRASDTAVCPNQPISFKDSVFAPLYGNNFRWDFGDGSGIVNCATCSTQTHSYSSNGTYIVKAVATTSTGCTDTATITINVYSKPTANFSGTPTTVCPDLPVSFTNSSTGATSYLWNLGNSLTSDSTNKVTKYFSPGTYTVTLIASNNGCKDTLTRSNYITVNLPQAKFVPTFTCSNRLAYTFIDSSISANTYYWDFGDGNTSTNAGNTSHTYSTAGDYIVTLVAYNSSTGCRDTFKSGIKAKPITVPTFSSNFTSLCRGGTITLTRALGATDYSYLWHLGAQINNNQTTAPQFFLPVSGIFDLKLVVTDSAGCKDSSTLSNYIKVGGKPITISASDTNPCKLSQILFTDVTTQGMFPVSTRFWQFGDNTDATRANDTVTHSYNNSGPYNVTLITTDSLGCKDTLVENTFVQVHKPTAQFYSYDTLICAGDTVQFQNNSGGTNFTSLWDFGDGSTGTTMTPQHPYNTAGKYTVKLTITDTYGCKDSANYVDYVEATQPDAAFTMSDSAAPCPPLTVYMTNGSTGSSSYLWTFGNNNQSSNIAPSTTYTYPGTYNVKLIATNSAGCKDSATRTVTLNGPTGTLSYTPTSGCNPLTVNFTATSSNTNSYIWDMNNGYTQTTGNGSFSYTFTQSRKYLPNVILSDGGSCQVPLQGIDTISVDSMGADFSFTSAGNLCNNDTVYFNDTILSSLSTVTSRSWTFGDGSTSSAEDPQHYYNSSGSYQVRLIIANSNGCIDTIIKTVVVNGLPTVDITASGDSICPGQTTGISLAASGAVTYSWTPSTGLSCTSCANPNANPSVHTTYIVTGTDANGCTDEDTVTIGIKPKPTITVSNDTTICNGLYADLNVSGAFSYIWTPSTGLSCTSCDNPDAAPSATTSYTVVGTNASGCSDTGDVTVTVITSPIVNAGSNTEICFGESATLTATGADTYTWSPTATLSCSACNPTVATPTSQTVYSVIGTLANGCKDTSTVTVDVKPLPVVSAGADVAICINDNTTLQATGATTYSWSPSTGLSNPSIANPVANPTTTTSYVVTGTNATCSDKDTVIVTVNPLPTVSAGTDKTICVGFNTQLQATGANTYTWTPTTGLNNSTIANPLAAPTTTTSYIVTGIDGNTCENTDTVIVNVNPQPTVSAGANQNICPGDSVQINAIGATSYVWTPTTALSCTTCDNPKASPSATTTYSVIGTDGNGCKDTTTVTVNVNTPPNVNAGNNVAICIGSNTQLQATGAATYSWSPATGLSNTTIANPVANPTTTTTYTVIGINGSSCKDTATVTVTVNPLPVVNAGTDATICVGFSTQLQATGALDYSWSPTTDLSSATIANPIASPTTTTTYVVTGTDFNLCINTDTVIVNVNAQPIVATGANQNICPADSAQLNATGAVNYSWSPSTGLSCTSCDNPKASPTTTTNYNVIGTDANGCKDTATVTVNVNTPPVVSASTDVDICIGDNTTLQATGAISYIWSPASTLSNATIANPVATPMTTTTYTVIGTAANGCKDTATVTVTVNPLPAVNAGTDKTICVGFSTQLQATGATSYVWSPTTGLSNPNVSNPIASPTTTTTYIVTGTDGNTCVNKDTVIVNVNPQPVVTAGADKNICPADSVQLNATGANSYTWSPTNGLSCNTCSNPKASPSATTTYSVIGTDSNGCKDTTAVKVNVNAVPIVSAGNNVAICIGNSTTLQATGAASYTWSPATGLSSTSIANPVASPTTTTTYTVIGTNGSSCKDTATVTVTVNPLPNVNAGTDETICIGFNVQLQATGATSYTWSPTTGLNNPNISNPIASPTATTTYIVTGTDANTCSNTDTVIVNVNGQPIVTGGSNKIICINDSAQLQASGATSYVWSPATGLSGTSIANPKASPAVTTTYTVIGTNTNGCKDTATVTVTVNPLPIVNAGTDKTICIGFSTQLQAIGATSYTWSPATGLSNSTIANPVASPTTTTKYIVTGTNGNNCTSKDSLIVTVNPQPTISAGTDITICAKDSAQLQATTGLTSYVWSPATGLSSTSIANPKASPVATTTYTVVGTNSNGCKDTATVKVNVNALPIVNAGTDKTICLNDTAQLQASGAGTYTWTPTATLTCTNCADPKAFPSVTTQYVVTGTATSTTCKSTDTVIVNVNTLPIVLAGNDTTICLRDSVLLSPTGASTYTWSPSTYLNLPYSKPADTITYVVTGTDANGCKNTDTITINVKKLPVITATAGRTLICDGDTTQLTATGALNGYTWLQTGALSCTNCPNPIATPAFNTTYLVTGTTDGCSDTASVFVELRPKPQVTAGAPVAFCKGGSDTLNAGGAVSYIWSPSLGLSCDTCISPIASPDITTDYTVTGIDTNGCKNTDVVTVTVYQLPNVDAGEDVSLCEGDSVQLTATGATSYIWSPAAGLSCTNCTNPYATTSEVSKFIVTGTSANGCTNQDSVTVTAILKQSITVSASDTICLGDEAPLFASGGSNFSWSPADLITTNPEISQVSVKPTVTTKFQVIIQQDKCFTDTGYVIVAIAPTPSINAGADKEILGGDEVELITNASGIETFEWSPADNLSCSDCANPIAAPRVTTTFKVKGISRYGCTAEDDVTVVVTCGTNQIFIPNTFTPNNDGVNDRFFPQGKGISEVKRFSVYNRWGQLVFDAENVPLNDPNYGWDGTFKVEPLKPDVFVYIVRAVCENGQPIELKGDISLIR